ncbi:adenylyl-sulfate kinase [Actinophytocola algeriensis]|uniref:Adenylyl-sulfate kinase n=1 Tax=Actinophytocola algeriensis TaxID=1768010 RepID=A0A7W7QA92_9PSEU|nr:adenylyl-sulfate kinase [Actinophytocola algeriensis]MBB4909559.1 bifunctional enzyme CysN/CysC [Actinophytocola algeriensis]MBE1475549.1 bifunctional enzyme CysN/CysC [Actinophytocola algeriensis]
MDLLRFLTCGSVDDGKSTLIGRLLYDTHTLYSDQVAALTESGLDFASLTDGLLAEREQGITIDVAYRYFATAARSFIVADTPGHEQYTRNMVTGASTSDAAVLLSDARAGLLRQTRRHSHVVALLGIRRVVLAVNKMDLVDFDRARFTAIADEYREFAAGLGIDEVTCVPTAALDGSNVVHRAARTPWYDGPTLLEWLETVPVEAGSGPFRMIVRWVNRPGPDFRGASGLVVGGTVRVGDEVRVLPGNAQSAVARLMTFDGDLEEAEAGQSVTVVLADDVDVSRGAVLAAADPPGVADAAQADLIWLSEQELLPGRRYLAKVGARTVGLTVDPPKHRVDVDTGARLAARTLHLNEIGVGNVHFDQPVVLDPYRANRDLGGFIVIDRLTNATVGAGLVRFPLRRAANVRWQAMSVTRRMRADLNGHRGCVVWFTGLSGAGKSTIADQVEQRLYAAGRHTFLLDGDNVRHGLNADLGFTDADRVENIRRVAEVAGLMVEAGLVVLVSFISPFRAERELARGIVAGDEFCEVFVDTPLVVAEQRDPKGLYAKARRGELPNFTGIDSPYEPPEHPELRLDTTTLTAAEAADAVLVRLGQMGVV